MRKIGRNEPCPCGSGKKYKKCCIDKPDLFSKPESFESYIDSFLSYDEVNELSTERIIQQLESFGIEFTRDGFLRDIKTAYSAQQLSEDWFKSFRVTAKDRDEDFPFFAAWILWERLAPPHIMSREQMSDLIQKGFEYSSEKDSPRACDVWLEVWEGMKYRFKPEYKNLDYLDEQYKGSFFIKNFVQDLEEELHNAGLVDKAYFEKRINYCREFVCHFPNESELIVHNMRRAIAESYSSLGNFEQAELEYKQLVQDCPDNPWGYLGWGDMYFYDKHDYSQAKALYEKGMALVKDKTDMMAFQERLEDIEKKIK